MSSFSQKQNPNSLEASFNIDVVRVSAVMETGNWMHPYKLVVV